MASLRGYIDDVVTDIQIDDTTGFPVNGGVVLIESELIRYTTATDRSILGCERGFNSTTAVEHDDKTAVEVQETLAPLYSLQEYSDHGTPVDHQTGVGFAIKGTRYTDLDSALVYVNVSDELDPTWTPLATGTPAGASGPIDSIQLSDGAGGFDNDPNLKWTSGSQSLTIKGSAGSLNFENSGDTDVEAYIQKNESGGSLEINNATTGGAVLIESNGETIISAKGGEIKLNSSDTTMYQDDAATPYITFNGTNGMMDVFDNGSGNNYITMRGEDSYLAFWNVSGSGQYHGTVHCDASNLHVSSRGGRNITLVTDENASNQTWTFDTAGLLTLPIGGLDCVTPLVLGSSTTGTTVFPGSAAGYNEIQIRGDAGCYVDFYHNDLIEISSRIISNIDFDLRLVTRDTMPVRVIVDEQSANKQWSFETDGTLTLPADGILSTSSGDITLQSDAGNVKHVAFNGGYDFAARGDGYADITLHGTGTYILQVDAGQAVGRIVANSGVNWQLGTDQNIPIIVTTNNNAHTWTFGNDGSLTLPSTLVIPNGGDGTFLDNTALEIDESGVARVNITANPGDTNVLERPLRVGSGAADASAVLQGNSTTRGFLPPRMTSAEKTAIATPAAGLMVYDTTLNKLCVYTTAWETITSV